jgi:hypothetical protein
MTKYLLLIGLALFVWWLWRKSRRAAQHAARQRRPSAKPSAWCSVPTAASISRSARAFWPMAATTAAPPICAKPVRRRLSGHVEHATLGVEHFSETHWKSLRYFNLYRFAVAALLFFRRCSTPRLFPVLSPHQGLQHLLLAGVYLLSTRWR